MAGRPTRLSISLVVIEALNYLMKRRSSRIARPWPSMLYLWRGPCHAVYKLAGHTTPAIDSDEYTRRI